MKRPVTPAAIVKLRADPRVKEIDDERADGNGYWAYLHAGWRESGGAHVVRADTATVLVERMEYVQRCDCEQCKPRKATKRGKTLRNSGTSEVKFASVSDDPKKWASKTLGWKRWQFLTRKAKPFREFTMYWHPVRFEPAFATITAVAPNGEVAGDLFYGREPSHEPDVIKGAVEVNPDYRRRGLATAMYSWAEQISGMVFAPDTPHTPLAAVLWAQNDRPFGKRR